MDKQEKEKRVKILWGSDENLESLYANHLFVSHAGNTEFHLIFGHLSPPLTLVNEASELPESVDIKPVAKIIISPEVMGTFIELLTDNYKKFNEKKDMG